MTDRETQTSALERASHAQIQGPQDEMRQGDTPWKLVHRKLRGRYGWAILLALLGAGAGATLGWKSQHPEYQGVGLIYIAPSIPSRFDPDGTIVLPRFDAYVEAQVQMLKQRRLTNQAIDSEVWKQAQEPGTITPADSFEERRKIVYRSSTQHIQVQFMDASPRVALAGVQALIKTYKMLSPELNARDAGLATARARVEALEAAIRADNERIAVRTADYGGTEGLKFVYEESVRRKLALDDELQRLKLVIASRKVPDGQPIPTPEPLTPGEIRLTNPQMAEALLQLARLNAKLADLRENRGEQDPEVKALRRESELLDAWIKEFTEDVNRERGALPDGSAAALAELEAKAASLEAYLEDQRKKAKQIEEDRAAIERMTTENAVRVRELEQQLQLKGRLEEQLLGEGRLRIWDPGQPPTRPYKDRRLSFAVVGGLGGAVLGLLIVVLIGARDRRLRRAGDMDQDLSRLKLLGLMPSLPVDRDIPRGGQVVAHCVHQIRTLLQIGQRTTQGACLCVSGPGAGSGKTTLTTALGLSFASTGTRTLLIDADLSGRGLTRRACQLLLARVRRAAGEPSDATLAADAQSGAARDLLERLGQEEPPGTWPEPSELPVLLESLIERHGLYAAKQAGAVDELFALADLLFGGVGRDDLATRLMSAVAAQGTLSFGTPAEWIPPQITELDRAGFNGKPLERYMYPTGVETLRFLPLRGLGPGGTVSVATIADIIARVRGEYDVALVDTGPVPGTVETSMVAVHADGVVMVVSPGDHRPDAERAAAHIEEVGAKIAGIVFNRADAKDIFATSMSRSSPGAAGTGA